MVEKQILEDELKSLQAKQRKMKIAGIVLTPIGAVLTLIAFIIFMVGETKILSEISSQTTNSSILADGTTLAIVGEALISVFFIILAGGIVLLVLPFTLIKRKINNRRLKLERMESEEAKAAEAKTVDAKPAE